LKAARCGARRYNLRHDLCKIHAFMKRRCCFWWMVALVALGGPSARAERADRDQPMHIEADALRYDDARQVSVFTGRVVLTKGTILLRGAKVEVRQDPDGSQFGRVSAEPGTLAFFRQKREGLDEFIEGEGLSIEYDGRADTVKFMGDAQLRRIVGTKNNDEFKAALIVYNNTTEVFTLDGRPVPGSPTPASSGLAAGRVRATLTPKPGFAVAPAPSVSAPELPLRESFPLRGSRP